MWLPVVRRATLQGKVAVLLLNLAPDAQQFSLPLADVPGLACSAISDVSGVGTSSCAVKDVWKRLVVPPITSSGHLNVNLREHQSGLFILG